jgi:hypothetical protein
MMSDETQPLPTPGEGDIMLALETRVRQRREKGIAMYGRSLQAFNGRRALVDALEEAVDLAAYLEQELHERAKLEARVAGAAQSHATHVASGNLEAGCAECFHFLKAQLGGQYAQLAGAFQRLWEAKPAEPEWESHFFSLAQKPEAAPVRHSGPYPEGSAEQRAHDAEREVADLKAQLAAARGETLGGQTLTRINRTLREQLQAANARVKELENPDEWDGHECGRATCCHEMEARAEKAERERDELHASLNLEADDRRCAEAERDATAGVRDELNAQLATAEAERDAALKAKEEAEQARDGYCSSLAKTCAELQAERKRADEAERKLRGLADIQDDLREVVADRDEAQAQAAALREALEDHRARCGQRDEHFWYEAALSTSAGKPLMERLRRAEGFLLDVLRGWNGETTNLCFDDLEDAVRAFLADAAKEGT